jgi:hypothetical protein
VNPFVAGWRSPRQRGKLRDVFDGGHQNSVAASLRPAVYSIRDKVKR